MRTGRRALAGDVKVNEDTLHDTMSKLLRARGTNTHLVVLHFVSRAGKERRKEEPKFAWRVEETEDRGELPILYSSEASRLSLSNPVLSNIKPQTTPQKITLVLVHDDMKQAT